MLERKKKIFSLVLVYLLIFIPLNYFINIFLTEKLSSGFGVSAFSYGFAVCLGIYTYFSFLQKAKMFGIFVILFLVIGTIGYCLLYQHSINLVYTTYLDLAYNPCIIMFLYCVPVFLIAFSRMADYEKTLRILTILGRIVVVSLFLFFLVFKIGWKIVGGQYMTTSYYLLPFICALMVNHVKRKKNISLDALLALLGVGTIMIGGARGALVCAVLFILLLIVLSRSKFKKTILLSLVCIVLLVFLMFGFENLLLRLESFVSIAGVESRTVSKLGDNSFFISKDRIELWSRCIDAVLSSPVNTLFGYGLWGDRPIVSSYSHNIVIEFITSFGLAFGIIFFLFIVIKIIKTIAESSKNDGPKYYIVLVAIPYGFFQLLFSDSFLINVWFFLLIGLMFEKNVFKARTQNSFVGANFSNDILHTL